MRQWLFPARSGEEQEGPPGGGPSPQRGGPRGGRGLSRRAGGPCGRQARQACQAWGASLSPAGSAPPVPSAPPLLVGLFVSCRVVSFRVVSFRFVSCRFVSFRVVSSFVSPKPRARAGTKPRLLALPPPLRLIISARRCVLHAIVHTPHQESQVYLFRGAGDLGVAFGEAASRRARPRPAASRTRSRGLPPARRRAGRGESGSHPQMRRHPLGVEGGARLRSGATLGPGAHRAWLGRAGVG